MQPGKIKSLFATTAFYTGYLLFSMVFIPSAALITTLVAVLGLRRTALRMTRWFIRQYGKIVIGIASPWVRFRVNNRCDLPVGSPCIFISNHQSVADIFLMARLPKHECVFISNRWPFKIPVLGIFARLAGFLNIQTTEHEELCGRAARLFSEKVSIISFPEGTRTRTGALGPFHTTVFRLALRNKVPIVPVCIAGNYRVFPPERATLHPGSVQMHVLPAINPDSYRDLNPYQLKRRAHDIIARELAAMEGAAA
jgi:1-acyl-sn-glycerol-3-phosphate acyltransferase